MLPAAREKGCFRSADALSQIKQPSAPDRRGTRLRGLGAATARFDFLPHVADRADRR